jgi:hypothetical protein
MAYRFVRSLRTVRFVFTRRGSKVRNLQRPLRRAGSLRGNSGVRPFVFPGTAAVVGIRLVQGYVWRLHVGVDAGWIRTSFARRDLIGVRLGVTKKRTRFRARLPGVARRRGGRHDRGTDAETGHLRSRSAFTITETDEKLIAALAMIGLSRIPNQG